MPVSKYRPYLTGHQIAHLVSLCAKSNTATDREILKSLGKFHYLIQAELTKPATVTETIEEKLGFVPPEDMEAIRLSAYMIWQENPSACTIKQLEQARTYRYNHDLMTPEEMKQFEDDTLFGFNKGAS